MKDGFEPLDRLLATASGADVAIARAVAGERDPPAEPPPLPPRRR